MDAEDSEAFAHWCEEVLKESLLDKEHLHPSLLNKLNVLERRWADYCDVMKIPENRHHRDETYYGKGRSFLTMMVRHMPEYVPLNKLTHFFKGRQNRGPLGRQSPFSDCHSVG